MKAFSNKSIYFREKVIIVSGATSGIGKAIAVQLAEAKAHVVVSGRNENAMLEVLDLVKKYSPHSIAIPADLRNREECRYLIDDTIKVFGKLDILVNNAGISMRADFLDLDLKVIEQLMQTNFNGMVYCTKYALPHIIKSKGSIVGISSIAGLAPLAGRTGYAASKHAMVGFLNTLRQEVRQDGVHVLVFHPGYTASDIRNRALNKFAQPQKETPRNEASMMTAEEVAHRLLRAIKSRRREVILTTQGKALVWLYRLLPGLADKLTLKELGKEKEIPAKYVRERLSDKQYKTTAIITINNKEENIEDIITCTCDYLFDQVIVVNDSSADITHKQITELQSSFNFDYYSFDDNQGKGYALASAIEKSENEVLVFIDADLKNLQHEHFYELLFPVIENEADMVLGQASETWINYELNPLKSLTSERAFRKKDVMPILDKIRASACGAEMLINLYFQSEGKKVKYVILEGLHHPSKFQKSSPAKALLDLTKDGKQLAETAFQNFDLFASSIKKKFKIN